jgi:hypothetical protein
VAGGALGGGYVLATMAMGTRGQTLLKGPSPLNLAIGATIAASAFGSILSSHLCNGSPDTRQLAATAGAALPAAGGAALITWNKTHNPVMTALAGVGGLVAGGAAAFITSPAYVSR